MDKKPNPKDFGYEGQNHFEDEGGWTLEGGEEAYTEALAQWEAQQQ
ncbi:MAG: hypothetical protein H9535_03635 [Ignavibacteria bacterium]|nr:hypothetical protein [Ignavibacteria bacterium]